MMMHSHDHEAKSESVKTQVGRRRSQQKKALDALHLTSGSYTKRSSRESSRFILCIWESASS